MSLELEFPNISQLQIMTELGKSYRGVDLILYGQYIQSSHVERSYVISTLLVFWETFIDTGTCWYFNQRTSRFFNCAGTYWYLQAQSFACEDTRHNHYQ